MAKYGQKGTHHSHHHSVALKSPQYTHVISSSTGSTHELKTVSNRVPKSVSKVTGKGTPNIYKRKEEGKNNKTNELIPTKPKPRHVKAASVTNYHHSIEAYSSKTKSNALKQKPTYIILTIDNSGEKGTLKKKETPKSSMNSLSSVSYAKQGQSYQQLSSLKKNRKKPTHQRTKSDQIIKSKPFINFKLIKGQIGLASNQGKNMKSSKSKLNSGTRSSFMINPPGTSKISKSSRKISKDLTIPKAKYDKKPTKSSKLPKEGVSKHKRVKSNMNNAGSSKMFSDTLKFSHVVHPNSNSKKLLKTVTNKNSTVYSYQNSKPSVTSAKRVYKKDRKPLSKSNYMSEKNAFQKPKGYKIMAKKSVANSPITTLDNQQVSTIGESGRPPTQTKKRKIGGHTKNAMSTHVKKKENYFYAHEDHIQEDIEEFPSEIVEPKKRNTDHTKNKEDDSSLFKYQEYKKMFFDDPKQKKNNKIIESNYATEQNKYKKLLNTHFSKATSKKSGSKDKSEYFNEKGDKSSHRDHIKFDVLSSEPKSSASRRAQNNLKKYENNQKKDNIIDSIVQKHIKNKSKCQDESPQKDSPQIVYQYNENKKEDTKKEESDGRKSESLVSFEYNRKGSQSNLYKNKESFNRNESYEIMELNSFNEVKKSAEGAQEKYDDAGLYGVFDQALENQKNFYEEGSMKDHSINDLQDSINEGQEVFGSNVSESELSPRSRHIYSVVKIIRNHFKETGEPPETTKEFYRIGKCIGKGAFGKVNLAVQKVSQSLVAIKSINKQYLLDNNSKRKVMQEVYILKKIRHQNVVHFFETFETEKYILLVMELCGGGDLLNYVRKRRRLKEDLAKVFFKQIILALYCIHQKNIVHRDIKLDNILLDHHGNVKIGDFGVSKLVRPGEKMTEQCGTPAYIAPEILLDRGYSGYGVDIWSAGVVLFSMLYGTVPFKGNSMDELHNLIIRGDVTYKDDVSNEAISLLKGLLECDPNKRLTTDKILNHEWLQNVKEDLNIFTETEKEIIKTEFTYNDTRKLNRNTKNESTLFTEHNLDSTRKSLEVNQTTKSVILAPFNSTKTHLSGLHDSVREIMFRKGEVLKLDAKVRDVDRQYEFNNNCELDNGVYNRFVNEEEDKKEEEKSIRLDPQDSKSKKEGCNKKQTGLREIEGMMEEQNNEDKTHGRSTSHVRTLSTIISELDQETIKKVCSFGYPKEFLMNCLRMNSLNYSTTTYYLLLQKKVQGEVQ
ncbi:unnamed protein product [Moneuplotes crassus]|uniref:Protein kinase domain-containing protein n=2 Tax=Euplotes crassus TaxID=5936 RepID=A0AAD1UFF6_EUPCR|nr:unnamed protein product [Moneuplotes crassus]